MYNPFSLEGKTILITGASSGLGKCVAIESSKMGAKVIISGRNKERLQDTLSLMERDDNIMVTCDLSFEGDIDALIGKLPNLDGLVLCAGITKTIPVKHLFSKNIKEMFQTNVISSMELTQKLLKKKKINHNAHIVFISSISTAYADKGNSAYAASKGAINSFSKVLALELANQGITSNCVQPGFVPSQILAAGVVTDEQIEEEKKKYPMGFGKPTDIAYGIIYLLSDASRWVTGSVLTIDGGVTLR